jgi:hypothetical protein
MSDEYIQPPIDQVLVDEVKRLVEEDERLKHENEDLALRNNGEEQRQREFDELKRKRTELILSVSNRKALNKALLREKKLLIETSKTMRLQLASEREVQDVPDSSANPEYPKRNPKPIIIRGGDGEELVFTN